MYSLVNSTFSKTYNPSGRQNALSDIKRLLTSRDTVAQNKACGYLIEVISRNSTNRVCMVEYLLDNDITVFLCEATANLDFSLFRTILSCFRLLYRERRFFAEEHASHASTAVLRALAHYADSNSNTAVDACLHFLCDLLNGIIAHKTTPALSHQSAYCAEQLLASLNGLAARINTNPNCILSSALVLHALVSHQPDNLAIRSGMASSLVEVLDKWLALLMEALNHAMLVGSEGFGMIYVVTCQLGMDVFRLTKYLRVENKGDFIQSILADDQEATLLEQCALRMKDRIRSLISELVGFTKENQDQISTVEYAVFLKFLLTYFYENTRGEQLTDFCDMMYAKGYLTMLPRVQVLRRDMTVRKVSTLILGEMLKLLSQKYLNIDNMDPCGSYDRVIHSGLAELQNGVEQPQAIGSQLQKSQPYSLLIYIYFYCQSSENPEEATGPLLPYLVELVLRTPASFTPPAYIIKALWLVFAMSTISNGPVSSLDQGVYLEKATRRVLDMLYPDPSVYYTHNPAILLWAFSSQRIPSYVRLQVLSQWLKIGDCLPTDLSTEPIVWELLLNVLIQCKDKTILVNCVQALYVCLEDSTDECRQEFACSVWSMLPEILSKAIIYQDSVLEMNIYYLLDLATNLVPPKLDQTICLKISVLITIIFSKNSPEQSMDTRNQYEYVCLKLSLYLLGLSYNQNDNRVLLTYINRPGYLPSVLAASNSPDDKVSCAALQLLSYVVHYYAKNNYQPKSVLQIQTHLIIKALRRDSSNERGASLLQLVYMVLNSGANTPMVLTYNMEFQTSVPQQCNAMRALMFRIQMILCCHKSDTQSSAGWKTLSSLFKHAIVFKNDPQLVATLTSQGWTHILIQFQLTQNIFEEFLTFMQNWLTLLKITIKKSQENTRRYMSKQSLVVKTMLLIKKSVLIEGDMKDVKQKVIVIINEILEENCIRYN
ncbi:uncharacterized protein LOC106137233 [Amyelois transitella]|uniref:uncharacterized protein LOC106137233 n=1 Tax=Amyelois transitella TaxID=680683 RepID=UPI00298FDB35|nr:uncharacterized protein LOC106137233 [Amyelois transitella]